MRTLLVTLLLAIVPAAAQSKSYVLKAALIFDGNRISSPGLVVITGSKIFSVGPTSAIPAGAEVIDFGDATLSPGFIDAHAPVNGRQRKLPTNDPRQLAKTDP